MSTRKHPKEIVAQELGHSNVNSRSALGVTPGWDSLNHISIISALEKEYQIAIPDEKVLEYASVEAMMELYDGARG